MRILFILELYYPNIGGIERLFKSLAERLVAEGHEVKIITTRFRSDLPCRETLNGVLIRRLPVRSRFLFTYFGIFGMLKDARNADIIHTTSYNAAFPARIAGWIAGRKVIITFHEAWGKLWFKMPFTNPVRQFLYFTYEKLILRMRFHRYIAVSDATTESLVSLGVARNRVSRIYNGLDYAGFEGSRHKPPEGFVFTYFGRMGISKGLDLIMEAVPHFLKKHPDATFKLIVPGEPSGILKKIHKSFSGTGSGQFRLMHNLSDESLKEELLHSSCVIIPSYSEGFCFAAAESIALGVPVISSGQGALPEVVSGRYITMDSLDAEGLMRSLEKAKANVWEEKPMKKFQFSETINNYLKLYHDMLIKEI